MKQTVYLIVNSQNGECRIRKTPSAGPTEYVFQVNLEIPDVPLPAVTITIPVPSAPAVVTEIKNIPFGVPWAISEEIVRVAGGEQGELEPWDLQQYAQKKWGLPFIYIEPNRWDKLVSEKEQESG
ncbi:hypothetical protein ES707_13068 [subsurface metagenome]